MMMMMMMMTMMMIRNVPYNNERVVNEIRLKPLLFNIIA